MRVLFIFILFFVSGYSYSQDFLKPDSDLFQNKLPDNTKIDPRNAYGVLRINMEVQQPIETDVVDDMKYLVGIVVDVETRDVEESNLVLNGAKITVNAEPGANYSVVIGDQSLSSDTSLKVSLTDKQDKRTLSDSGSDTFQVSGAFITDVSSDADVSPQKSITVIYDSV